MGVKARAKGGSQPTTQDQERGGLMPSLPMKKHGGLLDKVLGRMFGVQLKPGEAESLCLLLLLYTLQGVPMGISSSISFMLQEKGVSYAEQGTFSLASWPFSIKLLWAPLVDSVYVRSFGQRRTWVLPLQMAVGLVLLYMGSHVSALLGESDTTAPQVVPLTAIFFFVYFLLASQDIAVDGWAITLLSEENVGLGSTANAAGQTAGYFISFTGFLVLNSYKLVEMQGFLQFWGVVFLLSALCVFLTTERHRTDNIHVVQAYSQALAVLRLPVIWDLAIILLTRNAAFAAAESLTQLRLLDKGIPKQNMAVVSALMTPLNMMLPVMVAKWTGGPRPLDALTSTYTLRALLSIGAAVLVFTVPSTNGAPIPMWYYAAVTLWLGVYSSVGTLHFVSVMAFFNRVSDPLLGGTYMTMLNTVGNLGSKWSSSGILFLFDFMSSRSQQCIHAATTEVLGACAGTTQDSRNEACQAAGGKCVVGDADFHILVLASAILGVVWIWAMHRKVEHLQMVPLEKWRIAL